MAIAQRWRILGALTFARTSIGFQFQSVAPLAPLVSGELGLDNTELGWLIGLYAPPPRSERPGRPWPGPRSFHGP